jgi:hypothetical protein
MPIYRNRRLLLRLRWASPRSLKAATGFSPGPRCARMNAALPTDYDAGETSCFSRRVVSRGEQCLQRLASSA